MGAQQKTDTNKNGNKKGSGGGFSKKFVLALLLAGGLLALLLWVTGAFSKDSDNNKSTEAPKRLDKGQIYSLARNSVMVPREVLEGGASRAVPMTDAARRIIKDKYMPQLIGVPMPGEPFRLALQRPMPEDVLREVMEAVKMDGQEAVFIKTSDPEVLFGFMSQITGEMEAYCDQNGQDCSMVDVFYTFN